MMCDNLTCCVAGTDPEEEKAEQAALTEKFEPLIDWLRKQVREKGAARDGTFSPSSKCFQSHLT